MDGQVGGQGASRPRGLIFGGAVSTCLVLAWLFLSGGGTAAGSAAPVAAATDVPSTPSTTVTIYVTKTSYTPVPITETVTSTAVVTSTSVVASIDRRTTTGTVTPPAPPAPPPRTLILPGQGTTVTTTGQPPNTSAPSKGSQPPVITVPGAPTTVRGTKTVVTTVRADPSPTTGRLRWAAGTAGLAVTSAAGFGFLLLRRRGRYGL